MKKKLFFLGFAAIICGCATTANYEKVLNSWVGVHVDNLVSSWGPPQGSFGLSDGSTVIEYIRSRNAQVGGYTYMAPQTTYHSGHASAYGTGGLAYGTYSGTSTTYVQRQTPTQNINLLCKTRFTVSPNGIITRWGWQGNDCKAFASNGVTGNNHNPAYKNWTSINYTKTADIDLAPADKSETKNTALREVYIKYDALYLLSEPNFGGDKVEIIRRDTLLKSTLEKDQWIYVITPSGKKGWISKAWIDEK